MLYSGTHQESDNGPQIANRADIKLKRWLLLLRIRRRVRRRSTHRVYFVKDNSSVVAMPTGDSPNTSSIIIPSIKLWTPSRVNSCSHDERIVASNVADVSKEKFFQNKECEYAGQKIKRASTFASNFANACVNKWMNASPNKLPTARLTMTNMIFFSRSSLTETNAIPRSERRLTIQTGGYIAMQPTGFRLISEQNRADSCRASVDACPKLSRWAWERALNPSFQSTVPSSIL